MKFKIIITLAMGLVLTSCSNNAQTQPGPTDTSDYEVIRTRVDTDYPQMDLKEKSDLSSDIVSASFVEYSEAFWVEPYNGGDPAIFKDATFEIVETYKGDLSPGDTISVRTQGGQIVDEDNKIIYDHIDSGDVDLEGPSDKILFLRDNDYDIYRTDEDYYTTVVGPYGIYNIVDESMVGIVGETNTYDLNHLGEIDPDIDPYQIDQDEMDQNLNDGLITQEEYDTYYEDMDKYGRRLDSLDS